MKYNIWLRCRTKFSRVWTKPLISLRQIFSFWNPFELLFKQKFCYLQFFKPLCNCNKLLLLSSCCQDLVWLPLHHLVLLFQSYELRLTICRKHRCPKIKYIFRNNPLIQHRIVFCFWNNYNKTMFSLLAQARNQFFQDPCPIWFGVPQNISKKNFIMERKSTYTFDKFLHFEFVVKKWLSPYKWLICVVRTATFFNIQFYFPRMIQLAFP